MEYLFSRDVGLGWKREAMVKQIVDSIDSECGFKSGSDKLRAEVIISDVMDEYYIIKDFDNTNEKYNPIWRLIYILSMALFPLLVLVCCSKWLLGYGFPVKSESLLGRAITKLRLNAGLRL